MGEKKMQMVVKNGGTFSLNAGESVLSVLKKRNLAIFSCGKCAVRFLKGAPLPLPADRKRFSPSQLREGYRLACLAKPAQDCIVEMAFEKEKEFILTSSALPSDALSSQMKSQVLLREDPKQYGDTFVIADLGTTTIVLQLVEAESGRVIDTYRALNTEVMWSAVWNMHLPEWIICWLTVSIICWRAQWKSGCRQDFLHCL